MAELQIPDYMQNKPVDVASLFDLQDRTRANQQAMKMNEMKMAEEQQTAPLRQRYMQSQAAENESTASINQLKAHQQKLALGSNIAKQILGQASKVAQEGTPEFEQAVQQYGNPLRPIMASAFGHENDPSKPIDVNGLKSLASMGAGAGEYHPPVQTSEGYLQFGDNGFEPMLNAQGKPYMPPVVDVGLRGRGRLAEELAQLYTSGGIDQPTYERLLAHAVSGPQDNQQPQPMQPQQPQPRPQVHFDPNMSPEDQVTAQQDWANSQEGIARQNAQGGGVPAPSGGIPSLAETENLKAGIAQQKEINVANAKSDIELNQEQKKQKQQAQQELPTALLAASNDKKRINELLNHKGLSGVVGVPNALGMLPGTSENDFKALLKQVQGGTFLTAAKSLKGTGAMSEIEGAKAEQAVARLQTAQSENAFKEALKDYESSIDNLLEIKKAQAEGREPKLKLYAPSESQANQFTIEPINE